MAVDEAMQALIDCGGSLALAHHRGTFQLTDEQLTRRCLHLWTP
jgi:hypothetical protein